MQRQGRSGVGEFDIASFQVVTSSPCQADAAQSRGDPKGLTLSSAGVSLMPNRSSFRERASCPATRTALAAQGEKERALCPATRKGERAGHAPSHPDGPSSPG